MDKAKKALITDIKRFAVHDGNGIRTTIFFKGCPLRCVWCHNPETFSAKKEMAVYMHKCKNCGKCKEVCPHHLEKCDFCGKCEDSCPNDARKIYGREMSVEDILAILLKDKAFYDESGGGITLSGGECLLQPEVCAELLKKCKEQDIHTAVDTCGCVPKEAFDMVLPYTDIFLYDLKAYDEAVHIKCTGVSNKLILENIKYLDSIGCKTEIRIPYVPEHNDNQIKKLAAFCRFLNHVTKVRILPYHDYANSKYQALSLKNTLPKVRIPTREECDRLEALFLK